LQKNPDNIDGYYERGELLSEIAMDKNKQDALQAISGSAADPQRDALEKMMADFNTVAAAKDKDPKKVEKLQKKIDDIVSDLWRDFYNQAVQSDSLLSERLAAGDSARVEGETILDNDANNALRNADVSILLIPGRWNAYALKAQVYDNLGMTQKATTIWEEALAVLDKQRAAKPNDKDLQAAHDLVQLHLLQNYFDLEQYEQTVKTADVILAVDSTSMDAVQFKAYAIARMANDESRPKDELERLKNEAISALRSARSARPDDEIIVYYIGQFYLQLEDTARAIDAFQEYLAIDSTDRDVLFTVGYFYLEGGSHIDSKKAELYFKKLVDAHPEDGPGWINYGVAQIRNGKTAEGSKAVEKGEQLSQ
jgi:tetratricopeptide (TPR) repeat protein